MTRHDTGSTLIEMIVTLAVMGVVAGVVTLALSGTSANKNAERHALVADAARRAIHGRQPVTIQVIMDGHLATATFFPDGAAVGDSVFQLDRFAGALPNAR